MQKGLFYIILSFILTLAVTEYVWIELLREEQVVAELETEKEFEEDLREESLSSEKQKQPHFFSSQSQSFSFIICFNFSAVGPNPLRSLVKCNSPKLFILHQQLRVHC